MKAVGEGTARYEKLNMPVAVYERTSPAATREKIAPVTAPLTVRLMNFSTAPLLAAGTRRAHQSGKEDLSRARAGGPRIGTAGLVGGVLLLLVALDHRAVVAGE